MTKELKCEFQKEIDNEKICKAFEVNRYGDIICQEEDCQLCKLKAENAILKSCLQEIKTIAEENKDTAQYGGICKSILMEITKAEEE